MQTVLKQSNRLINKYRGNHVNNLVSKRSLLTITGSSYLLPTLRLTRSDTPENISSGIDSELARNKAAQVLLNPSSSRKVIWTVPIILDLGALAPDGSPYYKPPTPEYLKEFVDVLDDRGMRVVGLANIAECGGLPEAAASSLGIPAVFGVRTASSKVGNVSDAYDIRDLFKVVAKHQEEFSVINDCVDIEKSSTMVSEEEEIDDSNIIVSPAIDVALSKLSYRDLQRTCKQSNLQARGKAEDLIKRIKNQFEIDPSSIVMKPSNEPLLENEVATSNIHSTHIHKGNIRSGQQITCEGKSLIVMGNVHSGGEVMADGDIYIFGKLQGRALAGLHANLALGNDQSINNMCKIYARCFDPELVGVGSVFMTGSNISENILGTSKNVVVSLKIEDDEDPSLHIESNE